MQTVHVVLTERDIMKNKRKGVQLRDMRCPSLLFRFSKKGSSNGTFHCLLTDKGKTTSKVIGQHPIVSIDNARQAANKLKLNIHAEKYSLCGSRRFDEVGELLTWYWNFRRLQLSTKAATLRNIQYQVNTLLIPNIGNWSLVEIQAGKLAEQWLQMLRASFALSTLRGAFQCLKAAINQADKLGFVEVNPLSKTNFSDLTSLNVKPKTSRISRLQLANLLGKINRLPMQKKILCLICLGFLTRNQETTLAKWVDIDFVRGYWSIPAEHTKTGQEISHPIPPNMKELLHAYRQWQRQNVGRSEYLFPRKKLYKPISPSTACHQLQDANNGEFTLHDLRKYGSSYLRDLGSDYYIVERILNHRKTQLDATYIHTTSQKIIRQVLEKWYRCILE
jgi:integrase